MTIHLLTHTHAPAVGDIRAAGTGDAIVIRPGAMERRDWPTYWLAVGVAVKRGASMHMTAQDGES